MLSISLNKLLIQIGTCNDYYNYNDYLHVYYKLFTYFVCLVINVLQ